MPYNRTLDRVTGHDYPGVRSQGFVRWEIDELELGARVAMALDDPEQAWWELIGTPMLKREYEAEINSRNTDDDRMGGVGPEHL